MITVSLKYIGWIQVYVKDTVIKYSTLKMKYLFFKLHCKIFQFIRKRGYFKVNQFSYVTFSALYILERGEYVFEIYFEKNY
jgi:hypothetical protein